jgi:hypothetical protein
MWSRSPANTTAHRSHSQSIVELGGHEGCDKLDIELLDGSSKRFVHFNFFLLPTAFVVVSRKRSLILSLVNAA